jgi:hypothetical protein
MIEIKRTEQEINAVLDDAMDVQETGTSRFPSMTYEDGLATMWNWLVGDESESPME